MTEVSQEVFRSVYRKRDSFLHRSSYMRRGKTYAIHAGLGDAGVELSGKQVFDFGFGPGNFLWSCPLDCDLAGCEIDPVHVKAFAEDLEKRGQRAVDLRVASDESDDYAAAFGGDRFDIIVMSHVLEHIPEPSEVLKAAREALNPGGCIVVILPINEKIPDPKHYHAVTAEMSRGWFEAAGLQVPVCRELGFVNYLIQLWVGKQSKIGRLVAQGLGLGLGLASGLFSPQWWWRATDCLGGKRGQIVLVGTDDLPTNESGGNTSAPDKPVSKPKKIFVTGGSGFIGTNLVSELESRGLEICNYDHSAPNIEDHKKYWTEGDLLDVSLMAKTVREFAPDCVVHLGARADCDENTTVEKGYQANTTGVANFLEAMKGCPGIERIIVTSTQYVCGPSRQPEHDEDFFPHTIYGQSKVETEKLTRAAGLESTWTIIRPVNIWGPYHARYCREFWKVAAKGWYVHPNVPAPTRTYGYIGNVIWQIMGLLDAKKEDVHEQVFYVGDHPIRIDRWSIGFCEALRGKKPWRIPLFVIKGLALVGDGISAITRKPFLITSSRLKSMTVDYISPIDKTEALLGSAPHSLEEGIETTAKWYLEWRKTQDQS